SRTSELPQSDLTLLQPPSSHPCAPIQSDSGSADRISGVMCSWRIATHAAFKPPNRKLICMSADAEERGSASGISPTWVRVKSQSEQIGGRRAMRNSVLDRILQLESDRKTAFLVQFRLGPRQSDQALFKGAFRIPSRQEAGSEPIAEHHPVDEAVLKSAANLRGV